MLILSSSLFEICFKRETVWINTYDIAETRHLLFRSLAGNYRPIAVEYICLLDIETYPAHML